MTVQELILALQNFWTQKGCLLGQPYDMEKGAGTFNPATFLRSLGPEPYSVAYIEPCRRPTDGRYGENPIRMQHYFQFQVLMKPNPPDFMEMYLDSLRAIGIDPLKHDLRFVHDDWETAALGAWGLGWEVWCDGTEITQFTYFQQVGGVDLDMISGEITYGVERLAMFLQKKKSVFELDYNQTYTYGDLYHSNEVDFSKFNFEMADIERQRRFFNEYEQECMRLCELKNPAPALDFAMKASHSFNLLDARNAISVNERQGYVLRIRTLAKAIAENWIAEREQLGFPLSRKYQEFPSTLPSDTQLTLPTLAQQEPLLIELGVEEMPAGVFQSLLSQLPQLWEKAFAPLNLQAEPFEFHVSPRRIVIYTPSIQTQQANQIQILKGPPIQQAKDAAGNWTKAAEGFCKKNQLSLNEITTKKIDQGEYLYAEKNILGKSTSELLQDLIPSLFSQIHWYKTMRWGTGKEQPFVRPVSWLMVLLGPQVISTQFAGVKSSRFTKGHRFLSQGWLEIQSGTYFDVLKKEKVLVKHEERKEAIRNLILNLCQKNGWKWRVDEDLLSHVSHLVEYPYAVVGSFPQEYIHLPEEVLVTEMKVHQKYFALYKDGKITHHFIAISNIPPDDAPAIKEGYENVLVSRLRDAQFFITEDLKKTLLSRQEGLKSLLFATGLGSVYEKTQRIEKLSGWIAEEIQLSVQQRKDISTLCSLCKSDLLSQMVYEFPELQGEMGFYYATQEGYPLQVCEGIRDHYLPKDAEDQLPPHIESALVGLADRLDTMVGLFLIGKIPTGSTDPFGLRRTCLGTISIMIHHGIQLKLENLLKQALLGYAPLQASENIIEDLLVFTKTRLRVLLNQKPRPGLPGDLPKDTIEAVLEARSEWTSLPTVAKRVQALQQFREKPSFDDLAVTFKRVHKILQETISGEPEVTLYQHQEEKDLGLWIHREQKILQSHWEQGLYQESLELLSGLRLLVDKLFEVALINDPNREIKENRMRLLQQVYHLVLSIADFSKLQTKAKE